jgi:3-oxoadipate CoA-transferase alpha subunit
MCMAARTTIVQVHKFVDLGSIDPEHVVTSGIFVDRVVEITEPIDERVEIERQKKMA